MTYNKKTNTITAEPYVDIEPNGTYNYKAKVSKSLYNKIRQGQVVNWLNPANPDFIWHLIVTKKANSTMWFYLP